MGSRALICLACQLVWAEQISLSVETRAHRGLKHQQCAQCSPGLVWPPLGSLSTTPLVREGG